MYSLILLEEAVREWKNAYLYYETEKKGLGDRFSVALEEKLSLLQQSPLLFQKIKNDYRKVTISPFPFVIIYKIDSRKSNVIISSVFHTKRKPKN